MTKQELAAIKARAEAWGRAETNRGQTQIVRQDVPRLVAEVERLQKKIGALWNERAQKELNRKLARLIGGWDKEYWW